MVDFISEVEEELRKDDYNRLLKKYGPALVALIVLIVAGTGFMEYRKYADERVARSAAASYLAAERLADEGDVELSIQAFETLSEAAPEGYSGLSLMRAAAIATSEGNILEAVGYYDRAAQAFSRPRHKHLAQLKAAYLLADNGAYGDVLARIPPLTETDAPYEYLARELNGYAAEQTGNLDLARSEYSYLDTIPGVPATIKERASQALGLIRASDTSPETAPVPVTGPKTGDEPAPEDTPSEDMPSDGVETTDTDGNETP